jgi:hypothetical protein
MFAHVIPLEGSGEDEGRFVADLVTDDILWLGHVKLVVKADNEPALQALVAESLRGLRIEAANGETPLEMVSKEQPMEYESQSMGGIEVGIKVVRGQFRSLRLCLESRFGKRIPIDHPVMAWLLQHTTLLLNARVRGQDGLTPWARARGRPFNQRLVGFGEIILYKLPPKGPQHDPDGNMSYRWLQGIFLGYRRENSSYVVGTDTGVAYSRALQRRPVENRWSEEAASRLSATPWKSRPQKGPEVIFQEEAPKDEPAGEDAPSNPRQMKLMLNDFKLHGFSATCRQCQWMQQHGAARGGLQHSVTCRARMMSEIGKSVVGQLRLQKHEERVDEALARHIERSVQDEARAAQAGDPPSSSAGPSAGAQGETMLDQLLQPEAERPESNRVRLQPGADDNSGGMEHEDLFGDASADAGNATPQGDYPDGSMDVDLVKQAPIMATTGGSSGISMAHNHTASGDRWLGPPDDGSHAETSYGSDGAPGRAGGLSSSGGGFESRRAHRDSRVQHESPWSGNTGPAMAAVIQDQAEEDDGDADDIPMFLLSQLACDSRSHRRETRQAFQRVVSEVYSPPRVTGYLGEHPRKHLGAGFALDLTTQDTDGRAWDFSDPVMQARAMERVRTERPLFPS